ncbi:MAG: prolyl oligopeptidase family serine peptidase, partial [Pseudomonadota bacterium]
VLGSAHTIQSSSLNIETVEAGGTGGRREPIPLPRDAYKDVEERFVTVMPLTDMSPEEGGHPAGSVVLRARDGQTFTRAVYTPKPRSSATNFWTSRRWMFVVGHDDLVPWLRVLDLDTPDAPLTEVDLPEGTSTLGAFWYAADPDLEDDPRIQIVAQGLLQPRALWRYDPRDGTLERIAEEKPTFDAEGMTVELFHARSADGTLVPYHLALPREAADGPVPIVMSAYGGFMATMAATYQTYQGPTMLARGMGTAIAQIRGGGEFGPAWHQAAMGRNRHKAFEDCVAVARDLVARGLAPEKGVGFVGGSNGGLLGAVMATRYPADFGAIMADVPVTDMLRFHLYEAGAAWIEEYGDPDDPEDAAYLKSYSPLHQVPPIGETRLPPVLIDAPSHDDRVDPAHARRFAQRLMDQGQDVLLRTSETGGHGGGETSERQAADMAIRAAFFARELAREQ